MENVRCPQCGLQKRTGYDGRTFMEFQVCVFHDMEPGICPRCGKRLKSDTAEQCPHCYSIWKENPSKAGVTWTESKPSPVKILNETVPTLHPIESLQNPKEEEPIRCPKCQSTQLTANQKGFGVGNAVAGVVLAGGIGLLGGFVGSKKIIITCLKCGHRWIPGK